MLNDGPPEIIPDFIEQLPHRRVYGKKDRERVKVDYSLTYLDGKATIPVAGKNKILLIKGREGSRKSFLASCILMSAFIDKRRYTMGFNLDLADNEVILHLDTEMDIEETEERKEQFNTLCNLSPEDDRYRVYNIANFSYAQRVEIITHLIQEIEMEDREVGVLVIDQVADLLRGYNVNDDVGANEALETLLMWKRMTGGIVMPIMHTNRGGIDTNGKFGKWIDHKAFGSLLVTYDAENGETEVLHHKSRKRKIPKLRFQQDTFGNPHFLNDDSDTFSDQIFG